MPAVGRKGDYCTGDGCFPPKPSTVEAQDFVFVDDILANIVGHEFESHTCGNTTHSGRKTSGGSSLVYITDIPLARVGDPIGPGCGASLAQGSETTFAE
jgi:uncharacterized Zn-binding protein involved in type VI secretion